MSDAGYIRFPITPRVHIENTPTTITDIDPHIFRIEEHSSGCPLRHTLRYSDILTGQFYIAQLPLS